MPLPYLPTEPHAIIAPHPPPVASASTSSIPLPPRLHHHILHPSSTRAQPSHANLAALVTVAVGAPIHSPLYGYVCVTPHRVRGGCDALQLWKQCRWPHGVAEGGDGGRHGVTRRPWEVMEDGTELCFDHGTSYLIVSNDEVAWVMSEWEAQGLVAEWKAMFTCFNWETRNSLTLRRAEVENG